MDGERFFQTTRGKIVASLRRERAASAVDLAQEFGLTPNAIRQHLTALEREGLVVETPVKRGRTKPTFEFSLTPKAESLFPQRYDRMLDQVLGVIRDRGGQAAVEEIFTALGHKAAQKIRDRMEATDGPGKVVALADLLRQNGVEADVQRVDDGTYVIREHNCPYALTVASHPEVCSMIHTIMDDVIEGDHRQVESIAHGGAECRFELHVSDRTKVATQ